MYYDAPLAPTPAPTKADPLSLDSLIQWLEKQPADAIYDVYNPEACVLGQWTASIDGCRQHRSKLSTWHYLINQDIANFDWLKDVVGENPHTFGAALERARAARS